MVSVSARERILIVRLSSLGDVIQTLALPAAIRRSFPQAKIGWAIDAALMSAIEGHPDIDYIHACPRDRWRIPTRLPQAIRGLRGFCEDIRAAGYDAAIDAQGLLISAMIPCLAGIKRRIGFDHRRELSHLFYTERYVSRREYFASGAAHSAHMLALAHAFGCDVGGCEPALPRAPAHARESIAARLDRVVERAPLVVVAPGTQWPSKQWPLEHWRALLEMILTRTAANLVMVGSAADAALAAQIIAHAGEARARVVNLAGKTTLPELYAVIERASMVIGPDSAPLHAAGAARCPHLVGIYGPTPPCRTGPRGSPDMQLLSAHPALHCQPCRRARCRYGSNQCLREVTPAAVFAAVEQALG